MSVFRKKYKVDYCGKQFEYKNARDEYRAGENVTLYYSMIATDTDYFFSLDGDKEKNRISDLINAKQRNLGAIQGEYTYMIQHRCVNKMDFEGPYSSSVE